MHLWASFRPSEEIVPARVVLLVGLIARDVDGGVAECLEVAQVHLGQKTRREYVS